MRMLCGLIYHSKNICIFVVCQSVSKMSRITEKLQSCCCCSGEEKHNLRRLSAGDGRAHEKHAAPPRAGEAERPVSRRCRPCSPANAVKLQWDGFPPHSYKIILAVLIRMLWPSFRSFAWAFLGHQARACVHTCSSDSYQGSGYMGSCLGSGTYI